MPPKQNFTKASQMGKRTANYLNTCIWIVKNDICPRPNGYYQVIHLTAFTLFHPRSYNTSHFGIFFFIWLLLASVCLQVSNQWTDRFKSIMRSLVMSINALPKNTSASAWFWTWDLLVRRPLLYHWAIKSSSHITWFHDTISINNRAWQSKELH